MGNRIPGLGELAGSEYLEVCGAEQKKGRWEAVTVNTELFEMFAPGHKRQESSQADGLQENCWKSFMKRSQQTNF